MGVDRCRFKRRIANVSDVIKSVLLKKKSKEHISKLMDICINMRVQRQHTVTRSEDILPFCVILLTGFLVPLRVLRGWPKQQKFFVFEI